MQYVNALNAGIARAPRAIVQIGQQVIGWETCQITHSGSYQAGTFRLTVPAAYADWPWWTQQSVMMVDIAAGFPQDPAHYTASDLTPLMTGRVDELELNPATGTIELSGRDLTSLFLDAKTSGQYQNQTASQVAALFASQQGLQANIQPTNGLIGNYYENDHVHLHSEITEWALLTYLARHAGVQCFVLGRTLHFGNFGPLSTAQVYQIAFDPPTTDRPYPMCNAESLELTHDLTLARDVIVTVRSWNAKQKKGFTVSAKASGSQVLAARKATPILPTTAGAPQVYTYSIPGLSVVQAQEKAQALLQEISQHELRLAATLPGDTLLFPWVQIALTGTGTPFDATYWPATITRNISRNAFSLRVEAKNHPTQTQVALA